MKSKKSFGQHFLINKTLTQAIADMALELSVGFPLLEVGPGRAALTQHIIGKKGDFLALDADREMVAFLKETYPEHQNIFIENDFLKTDLTTLFNKREFLILGNFPYNISSQILIKIIDNITLVPFVLGMFQKELADRISANPGNKTYGRLSVVVQAYFLPKVRFKVSPGSFSPPPKVHSTVLSFERIRSSLDCDERLFRQVVKMGFSQRRKMLKNTLKPLFKNIELLKLPLFKNRPEVLSVQDFIEITQLIEKENDI